MFCKLLFLMLVGGTITQQCVRPPTTGAPTTTSYTTRSTSTTTKTTTTTTKGCAGYGENCTTTRDCCSSNDATLRYIPVCKTWAQGALCACGYGLDFCSVDEPCCSGLPCDSNSALVVLVCPRALANDICPTDGDTCAAPLKCVADPTATAVGGGFSNVGKCV